MEDVLIVVYEEEGLNMKARQKSGLQSVGANSILHK